MAAYALHVNPDLHPSPVAAVDSAVCRLCGDNALWNDLVYIVDVLPAHAVAVLFLDRAHNHDFISLWNKSQVLHDLGAIGCGSHASFLVAAAAAIDDLICLVSLIWISFPVVDVSDAYSVDMAVDGDDLVSLAHPSDYVSETVDLNLVIAKLLHLFLYSVNDALLFTAL